MAERTEDLRSAERLQWAAIEAFADRGYHGTTTREIAARAGLSAAGIYLHHASKAELLELVVTDAHQMLLKSLHATLQEEWPTEYERLQALIRAHIRFHTTHQAMATVANQELHSLTPKARSRVLRLRQEIEQVIQNAVDGTLGTGGPEAIDVRLAVFAVLTASIGVTRWFRKSGPLAVDDFVDRYTELLLRMLQGLPESGRADSWQLAGQSRGDGQAAGE